MSGGASRLTFFIAGERRGRPYRLLARAMAA